MILTPRFYSGTFKLLAFWAYWFMPHILPPASQLKTHLKKRKPKLLFHASKEKIVHCNPAFSKGYESKFIFIAEAHADRVWSLSQEPSDFFPKNKERKIPQGYQFLWAKLKGWERKIRTKNATDGSILLALTTRAGYTFGQFLNITVSIDHLLRHLNCNHRANGFFPLTIKR